MLSLVTLLSDGHSTRLFGGSQANNYLADIAEFRGDRVLQGQTFGDPMNDPDVVKYCKNEEIDPNSLVIDDARRAELYNNIDSRYKSIVDELLNVFRDGDLNGGFSSRGSNVVTKAPLIVIAIILIIVLIVLLILFCIYACIKCIKGRKNSAKKIGEAQLEADDQREYEQRQAIDQRRNPQANHGAIAYQGAAAGHSSSEESSSDEEYFVEFDKEKGRLNRQEEDEKDEREYQAIISNMTDKDVIAREEAEYRRRCDERRKRRDIDDLAYEHRLRETIRKREEKKMGRSPNDRKIKKNRNESMDEKRARKAAKKEKKDRKGWEKTTETDPLRKEKIQKDTEDVEKSHKKHRFFKICACLFCIASLVLLIVWFIYLSRSVMHIKDVRCGIAYTKGIAFQGDVKNGAKFYGLNGIKSVLDSIKGSFDNIPSGMQANALAIQARNLNTQAQDTETKFGAYPSNKDNYAYQGTDGTTNIVPPSVINYFDTIKPMRLKAEVDLLTSTSIGLHIYGDFFATYTSTQTPTVKAQIDNLKNSIDDKFGRPITDLFDIFLGKKPEYITSIKTVGYVALILGGILILLVLLIIGIVVVILFSVISKLKKAHDDHKRHKSDRQSDRIKDHQVEKISEEEQRMMNQREEVLQKRFDAEDEGIMRDRDREDKEKTDKRIQEDEKLQNDPNTDDIIRSNIHQIRRVENEAREQRRKREDNERVIRRQQELEKEKIMAVHTAEYREDHMKEHESVGDKTKWYAKLCTLKTLILIQAVVILVLILLAILVFLFAIASVIGSAAITGACRISYGILGEPNFIDDINRGSYFTQDAVTIAKNCISRGGNGIIPQINTTIKSSTELNKIDRGFSSIAKYQNALLSNFTANQADPMVGKYVFDYATSAKDFTIMNGGSGSHSLEEAIKIINTNMCSSDVASFTDAGCPANTAQKSATGDTNIRALGTAYCMKFESLSTTKYSGRYSGAVTCSGTNDKSAAEAFLVSTYDTVQRYSTKATSFFTDYNTFYTSEQATYTQLSNTGLRSDVNTAYTNWKPAIDAYGEMGGSIESGFNCTGLRRGVVAAEHALCYNVFGSFHAQTSLSFATACLLLVTAICMIGSCHYSVAMERLQKIKRDDKYR